ncbi:MAG: NAD(P)/FAD-dependent oxidoreductase [Candidatus Bathyarchaeia archaeon]
MGNFSDVVIVGGGPTGSFCALNLAKRNINVTVFEEHSEVGVPCHCAGHLSINGLKTLGLYPLPKDVVENTFRGTRIYSPKGLEFSIRFPSPMTCVVDRVLFDRHIAQLAEKVGANFLLKSKVERLTSEKGSIKGIEVNTGGNFLKIPCKIVVDAEGTSYKILRQAGLCPPPKNSLITCINTVIENVKDVEPDTVEVFLGNTYAPGFYAWLIPLGEEKAKFGLGVKMGNPKTFLQKLKHKHPAASKKLSKAKILREAYHQIPLCGPIRAYCSGFLAIGDAAAQVKPTTGGGVIFGLHCAKIAADVTIEAIKRDDYSSKILSTYQRRFMKLLGFDIRVMKKIRTFLNEMPDEKLDEIISFCRKTRMDLELSDLEEVDFQGRALLTMWRKPRMLAMLTYFLLKGLT